MFTADRTNDRQLIDAQTVDWRANSWSTRKQLINAQTADRLSVPYWQWICFTFLRTSVLSF